MTSPSIAPEKPCALCGKPAVEQFRPFCSKRCADVDLNRWLSGVYAIPAEPADDDQERPARPGTNSPSGSGFSGNRSRPAPVRPGGQGENGPL